MYHFSSLSVSEINNLLDGELATLSKPRKGSIPFPVYVIDECDVVTSDTFNKLPQDMIYVIIWMHKNTPSRGYASAQRSIRLHLMKKCVYPNTVLDGLTSRGIFAHLLILLEILLFVMVVIERASLYHS